MAEGPGSMGEAENIMCCEDKDSCGPHECYS